MTDFIAVIPARYASSRLPGKPLAEIGGIPMVVHVARQARASGAAEVWVATDHEDILSSVERHGFRAKMTSHHHASGTERIAEIAVDWPEDTIVVNVQGDEPLIDPELISKVAAKLGEDREIAAATACSPISDWDEMENPNNVKVVLDSRGHALYFSRAEIPFGRDTGRAGRIPEGFPAFRHIGIYAYRAGFLKTYAALPHASIEKIEALEQLRLLWNGYKIGVIMADTPHAGVDTREDLERIRNFFTEEKR
ncbi:MAG TPA: 3-deoxy-manno-octulosonate cytidylyltransferase [Burkholderiales bacterium]|nr:3-deoxy-manno-octulosonate cytidylyltransferase [Burkholderiales bacterium]